MGRALPERPVRDRADAEERLIVAAADQLVEVGPLSLSVRAVAENAGVNHGLVHHYFGGKRGLLEAAMTRLVEEHALFAKEISNGEPVPPLFILKQDPRYLRAVVRAVLDGEMELATIELRLGVSVPNSAMKHLLNLKDGAKSTLEIKALVMLAMSMEMGWAVLEPFLFAATEIDSTEQERLLEHVRQMRAEMLESLLK
jgi:TetR/AcrR family transcriptional regulator, repressor for neighboring sulfatase